MDYFYSKKKFINTKKFLTLKLSALKCVKEKKFNFFVGKNFFIFYLIDLLPEN